MTTTFPNYPATSFEGAVDLTIFSSNQLGSIINEDATTEIETESGNIPTLRKALVDNFYFKSPIPWVSGTTTIVFNQLYAYEDSTTNGWFYAPSALSTNPIPLGNSPVGDSRWRLYTLKTVVDERLLLIKSTFSAGKVVERKGDLLEISLGKGVAWCRYLGVLPHTVVGSTPQTDGGIYSESNPSGLWEMVGDVTLRTELVSPNGAELVGVQPRGNLSQVVNWVTPEQFGAIGDGTVHPLSERYATLAAAQAVYPHVTSLTQTIDWAACQSAENYTRGIACVWVKRVVNYHLGDGQLTLSEQSWWIGYADPQNDKPGARFTKNLPLTPQGIDACSIVRVAVSSGPDIFQRGIVFDGFQLRYPVARRAATKGKGTVGLHIGTAIKSNFNVSVWGAEYAVYDPAGWSNTGRLAWDTCHKGYFQPPKIAAGDYAGLGGHTSNDFRIESDMCPFPITLFGDAYSQYLGYYEGISLTDPIYDAANETACGITSISAHTVTLRMGRELWNGVDTCLYLDNEVTLEIMPFGDAQYPASTGEGTSLDSFYTNWGGSNTIANFKCLKLGRAIHNMYSDKASTLVIENAGYYMGNFRTDVTVTRYFFNGGGSLSSNIVLIGGYLNITQESGAAPTAFALNVIDYSKADIQGCRGAEVYISPSTVYKWQSKNRWVVRNNVSVPMTISGTNGQYADFSAPSGYDIVDIHRVTTNLGDSATYIQYRPAIYSYNEGSATLRVGTTYYASQLTATGMPIIRVKNSYVG